MAAEDHGLAPLVPADRPVLSEAAAVEVLAFLVTAARTQLDEAAEYAPFRMMTAARRLADHLEPHASDAVLPLIAAIRAMPLTATPSADPGGYAGRLDAVAITLADCLRALAPEEPSS